MSIFKGTCVKHAPNMLDIDSVGFVHGGTNEGRRL